jgi:hypothetical protein
MTHVTNTAHGQTLPGPRIGALLGSPRARLVADLRYNRTAATRKPGLLSDTACSYRVGNAVGCTPLINKHLTASVSAEFFEQKGLAAGCKIRDYKPVILKLGVLAPQLFPAGQ